MAETRGRTGRRKDEDKGPRSLLTKPFEALEEKTSEAAGAVGLRGGGEVSPLARTVAAAAGAAIVGGLAGAVKALLERRRQDDGEDEGDGSDVGSARGETEAPAGDEQDDGPEAETAEAEPEPQEGDEEDDGPEAEAAEAEPEPQEGDEEDDGPEAEAAEAEPEESDEEQQDEPESAGGAARPDEEAEPSGERDRDGVSGQGLPASELRRVIEQARSQLQELVGSEPESISSVERVDGGWRVSLEVVEVRRVPDSTDVLCTYDVVLEGDDCAVVSLDRTRRYRRSQVDE